MSAASTREAISGKSFLIVDGDRAGLDQLERYLLMEAAHKVYPATSPLQALRILQDRRTPVDCVICSNKRGKISGIEFLENVRGGRWGASLRDVPFILMMKEMDGPMIRRADSSAVSGYIMGEVDRTKVTDIIGKVVSGVEVDGPLKRYGIAHVRLGGADVILVPVGGEFARLDAAAQARVHEMLNTAGAESGLAGVVIPVWETNGGAMGFLAPTNFHGVLSAVTMDFVRSNVNRALSLDAALPFTEEYRPPKRPAMLSAGAQDKIGHGSGESAGSSPYSDQQKNAPKQREFGSAKPAAAPAMGPEYQGAPNGANDTGSAGHRCMTHEDIGKVILAYRQLTPEKFLKAFLRSQNTFETAPGNMLVPVMHEYYFGLDVLRKALFPEVDLRKSLKFIGELTLALDQAMMRSITYLPEVKTSYSINLNIQSVFTPPFENILRAASTQDLTIEFRQSNIVEFYDEFVTARSLLESKGIKIAVDRIFPDTFGLVNLAQIGARSAKLNWAGIDRWREVRTKSLQQMLDAGILLTVSRVDAAAAIDLTTELGFKRFQGFYVDRIAAGQAA